MTDTNITKHYQDSFKSYKSKNPNFVLSLYAGFELMIRDLYKTRSNCSLFYHLDSTESGFIAKVATRITESLDINVAYIRALNNKAKHSTYLDSLKYDLIHSPKTVHNRYFKCFNHLFETLDRTYQYKLTYRFPSFKNKTIPKTYTIGSKPYYPSLRDSEDENLINKEALKNISDYDHFIEKLSKSENSRFKIFDVQRDRIRYVIGTTPKRVRSNISYDHKKQGFYFKDDDNKSMLVYLDDGCTLKIVKLKDSKTRFSKTHVLGLFDKSNRLVYYTSLRIKKMAEYIVRLIEAVNHY